MFWLLNYQIRQRRLARLNQGTLSTSPPSSVNSPVTVLNQKTASRQDEASSASQDSGYGSLPQSIELEDPEHTQHDGSQDKAGKRSSPTQSTSPTGGFKFKKSKDGVERESPSKVGVKH